jgi:glycosyltransferase involved in cell wall biosynthesis
MRVIFDAYEWVVGIGKSIGVQNYVSRLLPEMVLRRPVGAELVVLCNVSNEALVRSAVGPRVDVSVIGHTPPGRMGRQLWQFGVASHAVRRAGAAVYFSPRGYLPMGLAHGGRVRSVVVCHDLIRLWYSQHCPGHFPWLEHRLLTSGAVRAVRRSSAVIAISQATAREILSCGTDRPVHVVPNGIPLTRAGDRPLQHAYLFAVTSSLPHKNSGVLLDAYARYRQSVRDPLPLVVCGIGDPHRVGVTAVQWLSDEALHAYYAYASGVVFLSLIEGFGFPVPEALLHGTPVLCSDIPSLREVSLGHALYVDPRNAADVASALAKLVAVGTAERVPQAAVDQMAAAFTWSRCADGIWDVLVSK